MRKVRKENRQLFVWTVNSERWMRWSIRKNACQGPFIANDKNEAQRQNIQGEKLIDGVITDDPERFLEVCKRWEDEQDGKLEKADLGLSDQLKLGLSAAVLSVAVQIIVALLLARNFYVGRLDFFKRGDDVL